MTKESLFQRFLNLFRNKDGPDPIIITICLVINIIVLTNAILHDPSIGYDAGAHLNYIQVLPDRLPDVTDTYEFFSPPLPYFLPSRFNIICEKYVSDALRVYNGLNYSSTCRLYDGKFAQGLNVLLSIGTTILLLMITEQIKPGNRFFKISALITLALLTVYYKTFSMVRGEPYLVFFITLCIYLINEVLTTTAFNYKLVVATGIFLGLLVLSRQWGFFIFPSIFLLIIWIFIQDRKVGWLRTRQFALITLLSAIVGGWFYIHLYLDYGTFSAFNQKVKYPSIEETFSFFRQTDLKDLKLFKQPIFTTAFDFQAFFPILYSDTWGDYWGYFTYVASWNPPYKQGNYSNIAPYLGRVNLVSIFPSLLLLAGFIFGAIQLFQFCQPLTFERTSIVFISLIALSTILGYLLFVYTYFLQDDSVVKSTYIIQFLIVLLLLSASLMEVIRKKSQLAYNLILCILVLVFINNLPAMITHYNSLFGF